GRRRGADGQRATPAALERVEGAAGHLGERLARVGPGGDERDGAPQAVRAVLAMEELDEGRHLRERERRVLLRGEARDRGVEPIEGQERVAVYRAMQKRIGSRLEVRLGRLAPPAPL